MFGECSIVKLEQCNHLLQQKRHENSTVCFTNYLDHLIYYSKKDMKTQQSVSPITWIIRSDVNKHQQLDIIMTTSTQQRHIQSIMTL